MKLKVFTFLIIALCFNSAFSQSGKNKPENNTAKAERQLLQQMNDENVFCTNPDLNLEYDLNNDGVKEFFVYCTNGGVRPDLLVYQKKVARFDLILSETLVDEVFKLKTKTNGYYDLSVHLPGGATYNPSAETYRFDGNEYKANYKTNVSNPKKLNKVKTASNSTLSNYRFPTQKDIKGWSQSEDETPIPYHFKADLNSDQIIDDVWIMFRKKGVGYGIFVFLNQRTGKPIIQQIVNETEGQPYNYSIYVADSGVYETWCGKSGQCKQGEPESINLRGSGIFLTASGSSTILYYWDSTKQKFASIFISD